VLSERRLRQVLEELNNALNAVAETVREDLFEKLVAGLRDPTEYRDMLIDAVDSTVCTLLNLDDDACSKLTTTILDNYLEADVSIDIRLRVRYEYLVKAINEVLRRS